MLPQRGQRTRFTIAACSGVYSRGLDEGSAGVLPFALTDGRVFSLLGVEGPLPLAALDVDAGALPSFFSAWSSLSRATAVDVENSDIDLLQNRNAASSSPAASFWMIQHDSIAVSVRQPSSVSRSLSSPASITCSKCPIMQRCQLRSDYWLHCHH